MLKQIDIWRRGLRFFQRTNSRTVLNLASFHDPRSLTWSWILSARRHTVARPRAYLIRNSIGVAVGLGQLIGVHAYRTNDGWQWSVSLFWVSLDWHQQRPMY